MKRRGISTAAQEAIRQEYESRKTERKKHSREEREAEALRKRTLKIARSKARHRGH